MFSKNTFILFSITFIIFLASVFYIFNSLKEKQITPQLVIPTPTIYQLQPSPTPTPQGKGRGFETEDFLQEERSFVNNTPILQKLPAKSSFFGIEYINEQHVVVHAKTQDKERDYQEVRNWFLQNSIDITNIIVEYR